MKKTIAIVGGGASALILACELDPGKFDVTIYERNAALGRKFLVAGEGGLNITHSEDPSVFITRYTPESFIEKAFSYFSNSDFIAWLNANGIETFTGSSGRVFPKKAMKPVHVLDQILSKIKANGVEVKYRHVWKGFEGANLIFQNEGQQKIIRSDVVVFSLGGASWPVTGSKGEWLEYFSKMGIHTIPFEASNCAFKVQWNPSFIEKFEGKPLKNISLSCASKKHSGEVVLTRFGIEGSGIYPLSPLIRKELHDNGKAGIIIDLKPSFTLEFIHEKLSASRFNTSEALKREIGLNATQIQLLKSLTPKEIFLDPGKLSRHVKNLEINISGLAPVDEAISTVGGIALSEIDTDFELKKLRGFYAIGEMLDYDAPTGGYLLQSCVSMGAYLASVLNRRT